MNGAALEQMRPGNSTPVRGMPFTGSPSQQWRNAPGNDGNALITNRRGKTLDIPNASTRDGGRDGDEWDRELRWERYYGRFDDRERRWGMEGDGVCLYREPGSRDRGLCGGGVRRPARPHRARPARSARPPQRPWRGPAPHRLHPRFLSCISLDAARLANMVRYWRERLRYFGSHSQKRLFRGPDKEGNDVDSFNRIVRHAIRLAWGDPETRARLRMVSGVGVWGCGDSANRLCWLLAGDEMNGVLGSGADAGADEAMNVVYKKMRSSYGHLVARVQLRHKVAGHAFVWVSREIEAPHTLEGYIYQTNIGIRTEEFDLLEWVNDSKSEESVFFPAYITQLQAAFGTDLSQTAESGQRAAVYQQEFMTQTRTMPENDKTRMNDAPAGQIKILWRAVADAPALERLGKIVRDD
jgi:hypothetical protein